MGSLAVAAARVAPPIAHNYLLLSDIHLGAGLVHHARPWAHGWREQCTDVDESLASCLDHYDGNRPGGRPWRLVIAGDFIDFIGMSLAPEEGLASGVTPEERAHGLGSAADHAVRKLWAASELHHVAFSAFARFVVSGNELVLVRGNHDVDFHWKLVQQAFVDILHAHAPAHVRRSELRERTTFCPWFYYVEGVLYVEHGHEFDSMCSYGDPLSPVCPKDPRRIRWSLSDVMLRYVARPTPGLSTSLYERATVASYLRLVVSLGVPRGARLLWRFLRATHRLVRDSFLNAQACQRLCDHRERRLCGYARRFRVNAQTVQEMARVYAEPANSAPRALLARLYVDRLAMITAALATLFGAVGFAPDATSTLGLCGVAAGLVWVSTRTPSRDGDPEEKMRQGAAKIASLFSARYVVMGHTHEPRTEAVSPSATYINLGHWGQDDLPEDQPTRVRPPCSHLVITSDERGLAAELRRWHAEVGPVPLHRVGQAPEDRELHASPGIVSAPW